ncbi:MAG: DsrE family protein [Ornithinibacter sp.]
MDSRATRLVVKVTSGTEALERLNQGFTVAATALASGLEVSLWLTGDATWMAVPGRAAEVDLPDAVPLAELLDALLADGRVTVCGQCASRRGIQESDLVAGVLVRGSAAFVEEVVAPSSRALVY